MIIIKVNREDPAVLDPVPILRTTGPHRENRNSTEDEILTLICPIRKMRKKCVNVANEEKCPFYVTIGASFICPFTVSSALKLFHVL